MLSPQVRTRITSTAGEIIEWWAGSAAAESRPKAVVVGRNAVVFADPRYNTEHRPVYVLASCELDPGSIREGTVEHRPPRDARGGRRGRKSGAATADGAVEDPVTTRTATAGPATSNPAAVNAIKGLSDSARGILGNLPPQVQELLQAPFLSDQVLRCEWHYEGSADRLNMFGIVLAGAKHVTLAAGTKLIPVGHTDASAHWSLRCYRAAVVRRRGI
jgi:hypothetical protein